MAGNSFGTLFRFTTWGESHGPAIGVVVDGAPPRIPLAKADIQLWLDKRRPGQSRYTTQRQEPDAVKILSGVFVDEASGAQVTTGTPIALVIENRDWTNWQYTMRSTAEFPADQPGVVMRGRDAMVEQIAQVLGDAITLHQGYMPELEILTPTTARGVWAMEDRLDWAPDVPGGPRSLHGWGHYNETYRKSEAGWRIASLVLTRLRVVNS